MINKTSLRSFCVRTRDLVRYTVYVAWPPSDARFGIVNNVCRRIRYPRMHYPRLYIVDVFGPSKLQSAPLRLRKFIPRWQDRSQRLQRTRRRCPRTTARPLTTMKVLQWLWNSKLHALLALEFPNLGPLIYPRYLVLYKSEGYRQFLRADNYDNRSVHQPRERSAIWQAEGNRWCFF